jgi:hypothetical protein
MDHTTDPIPSPQDKRSAPGPDRRQSVVDRRAGLGRRKAAAATSAPADGYDGPDRRSALTLDDDDDHNDDTGLERRRGPGRRRSDDRRQAEEGEMTVEQFEFVMAVETYKKVNRRMFPTWTEVLEVITQLGYRKVEPREIQLENCPEPALHKKVA